MTQVDIWIFTWWDVSLDLLKSFIRFSIWSRNYCNKKIMFLQFDYGKEYLSYKFSECLMSCEKSFITYTSRNSTVSGTSVKMYSNHLWHGKIKDDINQFAIIPFKGNALETAAFTQKRAPSGLLKWRHGMVRPTMLCLFLTFGIWGLCKIFTNLFQIRQVLLCRLSQIIGYSSTTIPRQKGLPPRTVCF